MKTPTYPSKTVFIIALLAGGAVAAYAGNPGLGLGIGVGGGAGATSSLGLGASTPANVHASGGASFGTSGGLGVASGVGALGGASAAIGTHNTAGFETLPDGPVGSSDFETIGMRQATVKAANAGGVAASAPGMDVANAHAVTAVLDAGPSVQQVQSADVQTRGEVIAQMEHEVNASDDAIAAAKVRAKTLDADGKAQFNTAVKDAHARAKALKKSMKAAKKADADAWADSRAKLAADYDAYTQAMTRVDSAASGAATAPNASANAVGNANANSAVVTKPGS